MVRSLRSERIISRTSDIGLRREPQPPMPIVIPSRSSAMTSCSVVRLSTDRNLSNGNAGASPMCEECHGPVGRGPDYREMPARILRNRESPSGIIIDLTWGISGFPEVGQTDRRDNNDTRRSCKETRGLEASSSATEACDRNATSGSRKPRIWPRRAGASLASPPGIEREARAGWL